MEFSIELQIDNEVEKFNTILDDETTPLTIATLIKSAEYYV